MRRKPHTQDTKSSSCSERIDARMPPIPGSQCSPKVRTVMKVSRMSPLYKIATHSPVFMSLLSLTLAFSVMCQSVHAGARKAPIPAPMSPIEEAPSAFVYLGKDSNYQALPGGRFYTVTNDALNLMNKAYISGCLEKKILAHTFKTHERDLKPKLSSSKEVWETLKKNAPYALNIRFYYKKFGSTVGYTYFYYDNVPGAPSETRIWSNTKFIGWDAKDAAAHWMHELSHQERAGAFMHETMHPGSVPYDVGDLMGECVQ